MPQADRDALSPFATLGALAAFGALGWRRAAADRAGPPQTAPAASAGWRSTG